MDRTIRSAGDVSGVQALKIDHDDAEARVKADESLTACIKDACTDVLTQIAEGTRFNCFVMSAQQIPTAGAKGNIVITAMGGNADTVTALADQAVLSALLMRLQISKRDNERIPCSFLVEAMARLEVAKKFGKVDPAVETALLKAIISVTPLVFHNHGDEESEASCGHTIQ